MKKFFILFCISTLFFSCSESIETDYQDYLSKGYSEVLFILNGGAETFSAYAPSDESVYQNLQLVGHNGSSAAWPIDLLYANGSLYTVCSGQNTIEQYDAKTLDYQDTIYLKNGYNPMTLCLLGDGSKAAVAGFESDEIILVDLAEMEKTSDFVKAYEEADLPKYDPEIKDPKVDSTNKNASGENHPRATTGLATYGSVLYASNVRYQKPVLLTDSDRNIIYYKGYKAIAAGLFREGTLSVFEMTSGYENAVLIAEINLQAEYESLGGETYFPGNGLNPQSLFILEDKLHIICTGNNGGDTQYYSDNMYIPTIEDMGVAYSKGDEIPGTDSDDGIILIMDLSDPERPRAESYLEIGGSPEGFRHSMDKINSIMYLAGVP
ncbi:MAG: hypothetical protein B6241_15345 [Spirochaetaceae bacterium 4572_59]|nr:MAG: hypothetical protein B6241_15345 [Spirochaetaceae bacterium 4572_59]